MKFTKKAYDVEAVQLRPKGDMTFSEMPDWLIHALESKQLQLNPYKDAYWLERLDEPGLYYSVGPGDWIVRESPESLELVLWDDEYFQKAFEEAKA